MLFRADLTGADLGFASLREADLRDANLSGADLIEADLTDAKLIGANLGGAVLKDTKSLTQEQLDQACGKPKALPPGLTLDKPCPPPKTQRDTQP
jgi:uncharacterized protein YjbI with pentapeptide repeats